MIEVPILQTERLTLRAPAERDFEAEAAFFASDRARHLGGPLERDMVWRTLAAIIGHWAMRGYGFWAVDERETGAYCGRVGLWFPEAWPEPEIGWTVMQGAEGRGIAREAAQAARDYAYETLGWKTAISLIGLENTRSIALAERMGAVRDGAYTHPRFGLSGIWRHPGPQGRIAEAVQ